MVAAAAAPRRGTCWRNDIDRGDYGPRTCNVQSLGNSAFPLRDTLTLAGTTPHPARALHRTVHRARALLRSLLPELPDIALYLDALASRVVGQPLERLRLGNPFVVRTVEPPAAAAEGKNVTGLRRSGKRIIFCFEEAYFLVVHLMIAGRLRWRDRGAALPGRGGLAAFDFPPGTLLLTEAGAKRQASIHIVQGEAALGSFDRGGLEVLEADLSAFAARLTRQNHTLKRALTDPTIFSGIGNAYSDEILHAARLSPMKLTESLQDEEIERLYHATTDVLQDWIARLKAEAAGAFPEKVTAFREGMAVHGRYGKPCPVCAAPVQRIVYARNEANYCSPCQTGGRLLSDRALSRLLREDWPRTLEEMEERKGKVKREKGRGQRDK
jgi:formamidopyrimidine-DNA glycosylase